MIAECLLLQLASEFLQVDAINGSCSILPVLGGLPGGVAATAGTVAATDEEVVGSNDSIVSLWWPASLDLPAKGDIQLLLC